MTINLLSIGHSNLPAESFVAMLQNAGVKAVADVRSVLALDAESCDLPCDLFASGQPTRLAAAYRRRARAVAYRAKPQGGAAKQ